MPAARGGRREGSSPEPSQGAVLCCHRVSRTVAGFPGEFMESKVTVETPLGNDEKGCLTSEQRDDSLRPAAGPD